MDSTLVKLAGDSIQSQERLQVELRDQRKCAEISSVYPSVCQTLDTLRDVKSRLEGTAVTFEPVTVRDDVLSDLRPQILMNVPGTLTEENKETISGLVTKAFEGTCREVVFGAVVTCPWYWATQDDRGLQAKYNSVFVVYANKDRQVFCPVNPHTKERDSEVIDKGWFYAAEAFHFANYLLRGKARFLETLFLPEAAVFCATDDWRRLKRTLEPRICLGVRGFLEQCRGQAVGAISRKSKASGHMRLKDGATLYEFCESFRLLHHGMLAMTRGTIQMERVEEATLPCEAAKQALKLLKEAYQVDGYDKTRQFDALMTWKSELDALMKKRQFTPPSEQERVLEAWLVGVRTRNTVVPTPLAVKAGELATVQSLMTKIGGPVVKMSPENIVMIVQAGSILYGLSTPTSDVDYLVVYADPVQKVLGSCKRPVESVECRGPEKSFEYGAYEVRLFTEMLWKGSVVMLELLFAEKVEYASDVWDILVANKQLFLSERAILQYFGLIKNNMNDIEHKRYIGTPRERKLFYQILHKLYCLDFFLKGECPKIKCEGETREFIMRIRKGPLEGDISRDNLYELCKKKMTDLRKDLSQRPQRLPENASYTFLQQWQMKVRGWPT